MQVKIVGGNITKKEKDTYVDYICNKFPDRKVMSLVIELDGEFVNLTYEFEDMPFERIRRITGYLVGTVDRFNNGKKAEEKDRVKHGVHI